MTKVFKADNDKTLEQKAHEAIFNFCIYLDLDFNIVRSPYFQAMLDAITLCGPDYIDPSLEALKGRILAKVVQEDKENIGELSTSWAKTSCMIMSHRWTDREDNTILDTLVYCPRGISFVKSMDA